MCWWGRSFRTRSICPRYRDRIRRSCFLVQAATLGTPSLSQTGLVPTDARTISFLISPTLNDAQVSLNGVVIPLVAIGGGRIAGDVSAFAGQTAQLMFTTTKDEGFLYFDDVQFSPDAIPEPSGLSLLVIGVVGLVLWHRSRRKTA